MSDGKISPKRDIVILSIKPKRPEYPPDKKYVLAKEALQDWDKLDAYYRGQILKLKTLSSSKKSYDERSSSRKSCSRSSSRSSSKKSTSSRRSNSGTQLTELFGDENVPVDNTPLCSGSEDLSDDEIISVVRNNKCGKKSGKAEQKGKRLKNKKSGWVEEGETGGDEDKDNYLSVPRDNFVIEFAISAKKRTPVYLPAEGCRSPNVLNPIKVQRYKPPVALGFNGVHIQKILYHKTEGVVHTSPTTTTAPTPDKPPDSDRSSSSSPSLSVCSNGSSGSTDKLDQIFDDTPIIMISGKSSINSGAKTNNNSTLTTSPESSSTAHCHSKKSERSSSTKSLFFDRSYGTHNDKYQKSGSNSVITSSHNKRKLESSSSTSTTLPSSKHDHRVSSVANAISSTTSETYCDPEPPVMKKTNYSVERRRSPSPSTVEERKKKDRLMMGPPSSIPLKSASITESIINKAKQGYKTAEMKDRERRRRHECQQRKRYAMEKGDEDQFNDLVDASMKALEMATTYPLLSPIRSP